MIKLDKIAGSGDELQFVFLSNHWRCLSFLRDSYTRWSYSGLNEHVRLVVRSTCHCYLAWQVLTVYIASIRTLQSMLVTN